MEEIYYEINIKNTEEESENKIIYYIIKEEKYGLKIVHEIKNKILQNNKLEIKNIAENKEKIKKLINILVSNQNDITQMQYIIDDFIKENNCVLDF